MGKNELLTASECDFNFLWKCVHSKVPYGTKCEGPCEKGTNYGQPLIVKKDVKKFNPYGCLVVLTYLISIAIWIILGFVLHKAIHVVSFKQLVCWFFMWNILSSIIITFFIIGSVKLLKYVDQRC